ncbi:MAG: hypothetical protein AAF386_11825, partial [Pseudomonadota bacterium]
MQFRANALYPTKNSRVPLGAAAGNWVGGTVTVNDTDVTFAMNGVNGSLQNNTRGLAVQVADITSNDLGRMFGLAKTVDMTLVDGS